MKNTAECPKCAHQEVLLLPLLDRTQHGYFNTSAAYTMEKKLGGFIQQPVPIGKINLYACRSCGYAELYVDEVQSIPLDASGVRLLTPNS